MTKSDLLHHIQRGQQALTILTLLSLPWYIVRFDIGPIPVTWLEVCGWLAIVAWLALKIIRAQKVSKPPTSWIIISILWLLAAIASTIIAPDIRAALGILKAYFILPVFFSLMLFDMVKSAKYLKVLLAALLLSALQIAALCISQWLLGWPNLAAHELMQGRASAVFNSANAVGLAIGPIVAFLVAYVLFAKPTRIWLWLVLLMAMVLALITTRSEGAWIALAISLAVLCCIFWLLRWPILITRFLKVTVVGGFFVYLIATLSFMFWFNHPPQVANPYTRPDFTTFTIRQCTWQGTLHSMQDSPWLGNGLSGFSQAYLEHATCDAEPFAYPHNNVLTIWSEIGLAGLIVWIAMTGLWLIQAARLGNNDSPWSWLGWGSLAALTYWLIHGLVDVPYFKNDLSMMWWIVLSLTIIAYQISLNKATSISHQSGQID